MRPCSTTESYFWPDVVKTGISNPVDCRFPAGNSVKGGCHPLPTGFHVGVQAQSETLCNPGQPNPVAGALRLRNNAEGVAKPQRDLLSGAESPFILFALSAPLDCAQGRLLKSCPDTACLTGRVFPQPP